MPFEYHPIPSKSSLLSTVLHPSNMAFYSLKNCHKPFDNGHGSPPLYLGNAQKICIFRRGFPSCVNDKAPCSRHPYISFGLLILSLMYFSSARNHISKEWVCLLLQRGGALSVLLSQPDSSVRTQPHSPHSHFQIHTADIFRNYRQLGRGGIGEYLNIFMYNIRYKYLYHIDIQNRVWMSSEIILYQFYTNIFIYIHVYQNQYICQTLIWGILWLVSIPRVRFGGNVQIVQCWISGSKGLTNIFHIHTTTVEPSNNPHFDCLQ